MADRVVPGPVESSACIREAVCIDTRKIFDSCRDKDCVDDLRVYPTGSSQTYIESALSIRPRCAELLCVDVCVKPITFNRGYYTVDLTYFYRLTGETFPGCQPVQGLAIFDKRVMLFGSEGCVHSFSSETIIPCFERNNLPVAVVDAVDPILLHSKIVDPSCGSPCDCEQRSIPDAISSVFSEPLVLSDTGRRWYATIGQFSIIRLVRDTQLLIPAYDYCMPEKECQGSTEDDPCELFSRIRFPVEEFFPPDSVCECSDYKNMT